MLAWNADSTNMPGKAHAQFLRKLYIENALANDRFEAMGETLMVSDIKGRQLHRRRRRRPHRPVARGLPHHPVVQGPGALRHDVGRPHRRHRDAASPKRRASGPTTTCRPIRRRGVPSGREHHESWWTDWTAWIGARAGELREPPSTGSAAYPVLGEAPGSYVRS
ncbi:MAG: hypothetical protein U0W40_18690 [Acidimicrobiia bacterium]